MLGWRKKEIYHNWVGELNLQADWKSKRGKVDKVREDHKLKNWGKYERYWNSLRGRGRGKGKNFIINFPRTYHWFSKIEVLNSKDKFSAWEALKEGKFF